MLVLSRKPGERILIGEDIAAAGGVFVPCGRGLDPQRISGSRKAGNDGRVVLS